MSTSLSFVSAGFKVISATAIGPATVRVTFSAAPDASNPALSTDALYPAAYQVAGPSVALVLSATTVPADPKSIDLFLSAPLTAGTWTLLVSGLMASGVALAAPFTVAFAVSSTAPQDLVNGGAEDTSIADFILSSMGTAFKGENWEALAAVVAESDKTIADTYRSLFDQLFLSTASGTYLKRRAATSNVAAPSAVGMSEESFRELAILLSTSKVTHAALWGILRVFYGDEAVRDSVETTVDAPFVLTDQSQIIFRIDEQDVPVLFEAADFSQIGQAQAVEVAAVITRRLCLLGNKGWAAVTLNPTTQKYRVRVFSPTMGLSSRIQVVGGPAQNQLKFPELVTVTIPSATAFSVSVPVAGTQQVDFTGGATPRLSSVRVGDLVNLTSSVLSSVNKGSFVVQNVSIVWNGTSYTESFSVANPLAVVQSGPLLTSSTSDFFFFRKRLRSTGASAQLSTAGDQIRLDLPVSSSIVSRAPGTGSYLGTPKTRQVIYFSPTLGFINLYPDGTMTIGATTSDLQVGDLVFLEGTYVVNQTLTTSGGSLGSVGTEGTTSGSYGPVSGSLRTPDGLVGRSDHRMAVLPSGSVLIAGGSDTFSFYADTVLFKVTDKTATNFKYNYENVPDFAVPASQFALVSVNGGMGPGAMKACGLIGTNTPSATIEFFSQEAAAWFPVTNGVHPACWGLVGVPVLNAAGQEVVVLSGGQTGAAAATASTARVNMSTGTGSVTAGPTDVSVRTRHAGCRLTSTKAIWSGGANVSTDVPFPTTFVVDGDGNTSVAGQMSIARRNHRLVQVGEGRVLAIGGFGRNLSNETTDRLVSEVEAFDERDGKWSPAGKLQVPRIDPQVWVFGNKVYVVGGSPTTTPTSKTGAIEVLDLDTGVWGLTVNASTTVGSGGQAVVTNGLGVFYGGYNFATTTVGFAPGTRVFTPPVQLNGQTYKVGSIDGGTQFTVAGPIGYAANAVGGRFYRLRAADATGAGTYLLDPNGASPALTSIFTSATVAESVGSQISTLGVGDASVFPDEPGWISINPGTDAQQTLKYLGRASSGALLIDFGQPLQADVAIGSPVFLLSDVVAFAPENSIAQGAMVLTDSNAGRIAAEATLRSAAMGGPTLDIRTRYPSDFGLGNAGSPISGQQKLSDAIRVWGGNKLTETVTAAQEDT